MEIDPQSLIFSELKDTSLLSQFKCGVGEMDAFIKNDLDKSIKAHFCKAYSVSKDGDLIAFFALNYDSLEISAEVKTELLYPKHDSQLGPLALSDEYESIFLNKLSYPALEISFLAVKEGFQNKDIGTLIIGEIRKMAITKAIAGCQFLTVMAYKSESYSAEGFYGKMSFLTIDGGAKNTVRMCYPLFTLE